MNELLEAYRKKIDILERVYDDARRILDIMEHMHSQAMKDPVQRSKDDLTYCELMKRGLEHMPEDFEFGCNELRRSINACIRDRTRQYESR